jgi:hypothetical protein
MLGSVALLRRYPVKSMLGENLDAGDVTFTGLALTAIPPPGATLDRAVPEAVLRDGVDAPGLFPGAEAAVQLVDLLVQAGHRALHDEAGRDLVDGQRDHRGR